MYINVSLCVLTAGVIFFTYQISGWLCLFLSHKGGLRSSPTSLPFSITAG